MAYPYLKSLYKLNTVGVKCRKKEMAFLWDTQGLAINYSGQIPEGSTVERTTVLVARNGICLLMLLCFLPQKKETFVVAVGEFSSLEALKKKHPELFEKLGEFEPI